MQEMWVRSLGQEDPLEEGKATHSSILAWRIPWTEKLGGLQSVGSQSGMSEWLLLLLSRFSGVRLFASPQTCSLPGYAVHGIFHVRILEWVAFSYSRGSS